MDNCKDCMMAEGGKCDSHMSLSDRAIAHMANKGLKEAKFAEGGIVRPDTLSPIEDNEADDLSFISTDSNDFKDRDDVSDPEHDSGAVDEMEDESLSGLAMKKRKGNK